MGLESYRHQRRSQRQKLVPWSPGPSPMGLTELSGRHWAHLTPGGAMGPPQLWQMAWPSQGTQSPPHITGSSVNLRWKSC